MRAGEDVPATPQQPREARDSDRGSSWAIGAVVLAAVCCAGPPLVATVAAGSLGAGLGFALGLTSLAIPAALVVVVAVLLIRRRR